MGTHGLSLSTASELTRPLSSTVSRGGWRTGWSAYLGGWDSTTRDLLTVERPRLSGSHSSFRWIIWDQRCFPIGRLLIPRTKLGSKPANSFTTRSRSSWRLFLTKSEARQRQP